MLSVMFGMGFARKKATYLGTAPQSRYGAGPDFDQQGAFKPNKGVWWFSCSIDGAEGDPRLTGHAVGWVSGELGYLTTSPNERTSQRLIEAMTAAR